MALFFLLDLKRTCTANGQDLDFFKREKVQDLAVFSIIYTKLRRSIVTGRSKQGERLNLHALAESFGGSITPVRDALQMLYVTNRSATKNRVSGHCPLLRESSSLLPATWRNSAIRRSQFTRCLTISATNNFNPVKRRDHCIVVM
ncbi:MAG TPA: GntR family transcriptional regulator [Chloroflexi bacterium]|nr:GntR family transcriptional regulator [Chloroflexota bacterium]